MASQIPQISWYAGKIKFIGQSADGEHMTTMAAESDFFIPMGAEQIEFNLNPLAWPTWTDWLLFWWPDGVDRLPGPWMWHVVTRAVGWLRRGGVGLGSRERDGCIREIKCLAS